VSSSDLTSVIDEFSALEELGTNRPELDLGLVETPASKKSSKSA
jgi:hypothetical protein